MIYDDLHWFTSQKRMMFQFATSNSYQSPEGNYSNLSIIQLLGPIGLFTASSVRETVEDVSCRNCRLAALCPLEFVPFVP